MQVTTLVVHFLTDKWKVYHCYEQHTHSVINADITDIQVLSFFLFARWHVPPSRTSAEACLTGWPNAQPQGWDKCSVVGHHQASFAAYQLCVPAYLPTYPGPSLGHANRAINGLPIHAVGRHLLSVIQAGTNNQAPLNPVLTNGHSLNRTPLNPLCLPENLISKQTLL